MKLGRDHTHLRVLNGQKEECKSNIIMYLLIQAEIFYMFGKSWFRGRDWRPMVENLEDK